MQLHIAGTVAHYALAGRMVTDGSVTAVPSFEQRVSAEIAPHLPPGFSVECVAWDGVDGVRVWLGDADLGSVGGDWEGILDGVEDLVARETADPFQIPRPGGRPD